MTCAGGASRYRGLGASSPGTAFEILEASEMPFPEAHFKFLPDSGNEFSKVMIRAGPGPASYTQCNHTLQE